MLYFRNDLDLYLTSLSQIKKVDSWTELGVIVNPHVTRQFIEWRSRDVGVYDSLLTHADLASSRRQGSDLQPKIVSSPHDDR